MPKDEPETAEMTNYAPRQSVVVECLDLDNLKAEEIQQAEERVRNFMRGRSIVSNLRSYFESLTDDDGNQRGRSSTWL